MMQNYVIVICDEIVCMNDVMKRASLFSFNIRNVINFTLTQQNTLKVQSKYQI